MLLSHQCTCISRLTQIHGLHIPGTLLLWPPGRCTAIGPGGGAWSVVRRQQQPIRCPAVG
eukprot:3118099-Rhodomonas_salina.1